MPASARRWRQHGSMMRAATFAFVATVAAFAGLACDQQKIIPPGGAGGGAAGVGPGGADCVGDRRVRSVTQRPNALLIAVDPFSPTVQGGS